MQEFKLLFHRILQWIHPDFEYRIVDQVRFNELHRRPPDLMWKALAPGPIARLDAGSACLRNKLFLFGGVRLGGRAINKVDIFDLRMERWLSSLPIPSGMAQTHQGVIHDNKRYIYLISGQLGSYCSPPTNKCFVFDALQTSWKEFIDLPEPRYAPAAQIWQGRLHVLGGSKEDRTTPAVDHWSIAVKDGRPLEGKWRKEPPVPRGGPHRASAVINNKLYVFGGQEGDFVAIPGHPHFLCTGDLTCDLVYPDTYMLEKSAKQWKRMADMPVASSHTEFTVIPHGYSIAIVGGQNYKDPDTRIITLTDVIQVYNARQDSWKIAGRLPYCIKETAAAFYKGHLYFTTGQRDQGPGHPVSGPFERGMWKAQINPKLFW